MRYQINQTKYLDDTELDRLVASLDDNRDSTLIHTLIHTGARAQEVLNLTHTDLANGSVLIRGLKRSSDRTIPLPKWLYARLIGQPEASTRVPRATTERVFPISYQRLYQIWCHYRPAAKGIHSLRHTFAIRLYKKTKDIQLVKLALGHRSLTNTQVYVDFIYSQQEMRRLIL